MKRIVKIMMITVVAAIATTTVMNAQRGMRGQMADSTFKGRHGDYMMRQREMGPDSARMHRGMWQMPMYRYHFGFPQGRGMAWGPRPGFRQGYGPGRFDRPGYFQQPPAMRRFESIPNLTEKQKKDIDDLRQKQQAEMQKFREDNLAKAKELRDAHHRKMMELLSDEQKKFLEGNK